MALKPKKKRSVIQQSQKHARDTGSAEVQIAILSEEIGALSKHLVKHPKDHASRRGLLKMVGKRRTLLKYLQYQEPKAYERTAKKLESS